MTHSFPTRRSSDLLIELARIGALKAEDRLLEIADREDGAPQPARALAREELLRQSGRHGPLRAVGVLRLVDQHMIHLLVQLVAHHCAHAVEIGMASCRARVCPYVLISLVAVTLKKTQ